MRLKNTTPYPDAMLRKMITWCCRKLDLDRKHVHEVVVRNKDGGASGHCWHSRGRITMSIGVELLVRYPIAQTPDGNLWAAMLVMLDSLVWLTLHELAHLKQYRNELNGAPKSRSGGRTHAGSEANTEGHARFHLQEFHKNRDKLTARWFGWSRQHVAKQDVTRPSLVDRRHEKAQADLARWQRRLKMAQSKVRKYRQKVRYYDRKKTPAACRPADRSQIRDGAPTPDQSTP